MPPFVALSACILFIGYLLYREYSLNTKCSYALWITQLWLIICLTHPISSWLDPYNPNKISAREGSDLDTAISIILVFASFVILFRRNLNIIEICKKNILITVFCIYRGISVFWSDVPFPISTWFVKNTLYILPFLIVLTEQDWVEAINKLIRRTGIILIPLSVVLVKYFPGIARYYDELTGNYWIAGVSYNKNGLGVICLICGLFFFWKIMDGLNNRNRSVNKIDFLCQLVIFILTLWVMYLANSATALGCLLGGIVIISVTRFSIIINNYKPTLILLFLSLIIIYIFDLHLFLFNSLIDKMGRDATLTGRDRLWDVALRGVSNPWIGSGYESFWIGDKIKILMNEEKFITHATQAHNGYLEIYLQFGYIGIIIFFAMMLSALIEISRKIIEFKNFGILCMVFFIVFLIYNMTEAAFKDIHPLWNLFLLMAIDYKHQKGLGIDCNDEEFIPFRSGSMA